MSHTSDPGPRVSGNAVVPLLGLLLLLLFPLLLVLLLLVLLLLPLLLLLLLLVAVSMPLLVAEDHDPNLITSVATSSQY